MNEKKGNTILLTIIGIATLLIAVVGATFAYFTAILSGEETATTITINSGVIGMAFDGGAVINVQGIYPRAESWATKTFRVMANTDEATTLPYNLALIVDNNTFSAGSLSFTLTTEAETTPNGTKATEITTNTDVPATGSVSLGNGFFQGPTTGQATHVYNLSIFFLDTGANQNADQGQLLQAHVDIQTTYNPTP